MDKILSFRYVLILLIVFNSGCATVSEDSVLTANPGNTETAEEPFAAIDRIHVRTEGWSTPKADKKKISDSSATSFDWKTANGTPVSVIATNYLPARDLVTRDLMEAWGAHWGEIKITRITELKVRENVFCYLMVASKTKIDKDSKKTVGVGPDFPYRYFDNDGDGKFETLGSMESVPNWVLR